ncbi:MAG: YfcC family protein [Firmicutes bacterium]|nr:YfcC family protein [Bacillota bacterium]
MGDTLNKKKHSFRMPHTYALIGIFIVIAYILTFIVPSGVYDMITNEETGASMVDPDTYHKVDSESLGLFRLFLAVPKGMEQAAYVIFFIFIIAGAFQVVTETGAIEGAIKRLARAMKGKEVLAIIVFVFVFSIGGATIGMSQETVIFIPIGIMLARSLGYDAMVGFAMISLGAQVGFQSGWLNPFTVGVAHDVAELPMFSGIALRLVLWAVYLIVTCWFIIRYAKKVKDDPSKSLVRELEEEQDETLDLSNIPKMSKGQIMVLLLVAAALILLVVGISLWDWYITEMSALFLIMGILAGIIGRQSCSGICDAFIEGARSVVFGSLLVGVAQAIVIIFNEGQILDTIVYGLSNAVMILPQSLAVLGMMVVQTVINFFVNSGSGQAMITMPVMIPIADILGITRQTAVTCFQLGDGISNALFPTSPVLMAVLSVAKIPYDKYVKFILPLFGIWIGIAAVFLLICNFINYGPF